MLITSSFSIGFLRSLLQPRFSEVLNYEKTLKIVFNVIAWVVLIFALLITILVFSSDKNNGTASLLGYIPLTVESDSMKPTFKKGDLIISKEIDDINSLKKGDVITFWTLIDGKR